MTDELRAAVERYRNSDGFACSYPEDCVGDLRKITEAYLAEHSVDDDERVAREWLVSSHQFSEAGNAWLVMPNDRVMLHVESSDGRFVVRLPVTCKTRGDVRRLLTALGIEVRK